MSWALLWAPLGGMLREMLWEFYGASAEVPLRVLHKKAVLQIRQTARSRVIK